MGNNIQRWAFEQADSDLALLPERFLGKPFDLERYLGTWYEIGRFPLSWEASCTGATAVYAKGPQPNSILVENTCLLERGRSFSRKAIARVNPRFQDKNKLILVFNDELPSDGPADYWVLDTNYANYALVGNATKTHLWVLSRKPFLSQCVCLALAQRLEHDFGYDVSKIQWHTNLIAACIGHD